MSKGKPHILGNRDEKYSRVQDKNEFDKNFDEIHFPSQDEPEQKRGGRTHIIYRNGEKIVAVENDVRKAHVPSELNNLKSGVTLYDLLVQPNGPNSPPVTGPDAPQPPVSVSDISKAAEAGGMADHMAQQPDRHG